MKPRTRLFAACCLLVLCIGIAWAISASADEPAPRDRASDVNQLLNDIAKLKTDLARLEQRAAELAQAQKQVQVIVRRPQFETENVPRTWTRREFNGVPYYLVPLAGGQQGN